ncbi:MAG: helix-turn-helix domain-containing protein [Gallintestinimicrobium sp.]
MITSLLQKHIFSAICIFFRCTCPEQCCLHKKAPQSNGSNNFYLSEAIRYIQGQYPNIRSLDEVSAFCNISRSHLGRLFRTNLHMSAQDYLIETRLNQARKMLTTTTIPVSEIAWRVGYQNELNLFRAFKNKYGMPPNTYRKQIHFKKKNCPEKQFFFFAFCL